MINFIVTKLYVRPDASGVLPSRSAPIDHF